MESEAPFDRQARRIRRDRAAASFHGADYLHRLAADELLERLSMVSRRFQDALVLGYCGEFLADRLLHEEVSVTTADCGLLFAAGGVQCDEDRLPFADGSFDLVVSVGVLDGVNDLPGALTLIRRSLRQDGLFLGAFAGAGSLPRLRRAMFAADEAEGGATSAHIHPQIDVRAAGDLLARAGFTLPVADAHGLDIRFGDMMALVRDLRAMGGTNILASRSRRSIGRMGLGAALTTFMGDADPDGKTSERMEIIYCTGWAPSPDQPKPAKRGSATLSLAAALKGRPPS